MPANPPNATFATLARQRDSLLRQWSQAGNEVLTIYQYGLDGRTDPSKQKSFKGRFPLLDRYFSRVEALTEQLIDLNVDFGAISPEDLGPGQVFSEFPEASQKTFIQRVRASFMQAHEMHTELCAVEALPPVQNITLQNATIEGATGSSNYLPKTPLPRFTGRFEEWVPFRDIYLSLVHQHPHLSNTQKFHQLLGALQGPARSLLSAVPISDTNYPVAWKALTDAFENKRVLAAVYLNKLLSFRPITGKPTPENLQSFLSQISDTVSAFKLLQLTHESDFVLFTLAVRNLPQQVREDFEFRLKSDEFPSMEKLTNFVRERQLSVQLADPAANFSTKQESSSEPRAKGVARPKGIDAPKTSLMTSTPRQVKETPKKVSSSDSYHKVTSCFICQESHGLLGCPKFHFMTPHERFDSLKSFSGCRVCLSCKHTTQDCKSDVLCRFCKGKHNSLTCVKGAPSTSSPKAVPPKTKTSANLLGTTMNTVPIEETPTNEPHVILATAWADVRDARGKYQRVRLVLDSASQYSYITQKCITRLGLPVVNTRRKVSCLGGVLFDAAKGVAQCEFSSPDHTVTLPTEVIVVKNITSSLPTVPFPSKLRHKYAKYNLSDKFWFKPGAIDALVGGDLFSDVVQGGFKSVGKNLPKILPTIFGHVIMGRYSDETPQRTGTSLFSMSQCEDNLCFDLQNFWQIEEVGPTDSPSDQDEDLAEQSFLDHHYRLPDGRFGVRIPFKSEVPDLSHSEGMAKKRFYNLEAKLKRNPELKEQYTAFMQEYEILGHMTPTSAPAKYVIPHHGVFNKVKLRVVFDASCTTHNGSLNDHVLVGPPLQNDIRNILLNFRSYKCAFITDAVKMYRQIEVSPEDRQYQHIFWRADPALPLQRYELNTVTYGMACSPFLALRCLKQLETEHANQFPLAARALSTQLYVDDLAAGSSSEEGALELQRQLLAVMKLGGFELAKWASNSKAILAAVQPEDNPQSSVDLSADQSPAVKVLGLKWHPSSDTFSYSIQPPDAPPTKRGILSTVARIFDPLGFLAPSVVVFKLLIQKLWLEGLGWDEPVPDHIQKLWQELTTKLNLLSQVKIDRWVVADPPYTYQLVGFSDASENAYCAAVYIRIIREHSVTVQLLTAKTRVAPTKGLTIPKLELCGALLLAKLIASLRQFHDTVDSDTLPPVYFSDSMVTLAWIRLPMHKLKVFVANRVAEIQTLTAIEAWHHVAGLDNPADLGSRGVLPDKLINNSLWWNGPSWLAGPPTSWPSSQLEVPRDLPETKPKADIPAECFLCCPTQVAQQTALLDWMKRFSSYLELLRVVAVLLRGISNFRDRPNAKDGPILPADLEGALVCCVKAVQLELLTDQNRKKGVQQVYSNLAPFQDQKGVWRVGGRIRHASIPYNQKHPILLPAHSHFTTILVDFYHRCFLHPSPGTLQALLQTRFWIVPSLRRLVRQRTTKCVECRKRNAQPLAPPMGDLPAYRLQTRRAFAFTGVDFAGPFIMRESLRRKAQTSKIYLSLFVCMETKALHLEAVTQLTTDAFLAAFDRFIARRGLPENVYSDNGLNFVGASRKLKEFYQWYHTQDTKLHITRNGAKRGIEWKFNPPHAPHFGGLWEAGVRSVKRQMCDVTGETPLTFEEFSTLFAKIEAILNSRPLCPLSADPEEAEYLSPGHFLVGGPLLAYPEPSHLERREHLLTRWQIVKKMYETFWKRWRQQYLTTLQKRTKWTRTSPNLAVGDLVLVKGPSQSTHADVMHWPVARVTETHPGADGIVRVATIRTSSGSIFTRPVVELIPLLPLPDPQDVEESDPAS